VDLGPRQRQGFVLEVLGLKFGGGCAYVVAVTSSPIMSLRIQRHLCGYAEKIVVEWCGCGDLRIVKELYRQLFFLRRLKNGCGLLDPFGNFPYATNNVRPA
jgi:hypothetical protein